MWWARIMESKTLHYALYWEKQIPTYLIFILKVISNHTHTLLNSEAISLICVSKLPSVKKRKTLDVKAAHSVIILMFHVIFQMKCYHFKICYVHLPLCDIPTARHFWNLQYWHLFLLFLWMRQLRSHLSYISFNLIVLRKKPWSKHKSM